MLWRVFLLSMLISLNVLAQWESKGLCQIYTQNTPHAKSNNVSDFWAQNLVALDLAQELVKKNDPAIRPVVHIWDELIDRAEPEEGRVSHAYSVASFFELGAQSSTQFAKLGQNHDVIYDVRAYTKAANELPSSEFTQLVNMSAGWRTYTDTIKQALEFAISKKAVIVKAAGNDPYRGSQDTEFQPEDSRWVRVGSLTPEGLISDFSAIRGDWIVYAPADRYLTAKASPSGQFTAFDGTSGAAPLVTGALANYLALSPKADRKHLQSELKKSALHFLNAKGKANHDVLNAYALVLKALPIELSLAEKVQNENHFSKALQVLQSTKASCESQKEAFQILRKNFYMNPTVDAAEVLASLYKAQGWSRESLFFTNWAESQKGKMGRVLDQQELSQAVRMRNIELIDDAAAIRFVQSFGSLDLDEKSDAVTGAFLRAELFPTQILKHYRGLKTTRDKEKFWNRTISIPDMRRLLAPVLAREKDLELKIAALDVFALTEDQKLKEQLIPLVHLNEERVWTKMVNFFDVYEPEIRLRLARILLAKPSEDVQMAVLRWVHLFKREELVQVLKWAQSSQYEAVRNQVLRFRTDEQNPLDQSQ